MFDRVQFDFHIVEVINVYLLLSADSSQLFGEILFQLFLFLRSILVEFQERLNAQNVQLLLLFCIGPIEKGHPFVVPIVELLEQFGTTISRVKGQTVQIDANTIHSIAEKFEIGTQKVLMGIDVFETQLQLTVRAENVVVGRTWRTVGVRMLTEIASRSHGNEDVCTKSKKKTVVIVDEETLGKQGSVMLTAAEE